MEMDLNRLKNKADSILANTNTTKEKLKEICDLLEREISYYDWVGGVKVNSIHVYQHHCSFCKQRTLNSTVHVAAAMG